MTLSGKTRICSECGNKFPIERKFSYCKDCGKSKPRDQYIMAGFGSKGNGAHVIKKSDFQGER